MPDENGCFAYGEKETEYLKKKDKKLAEVIDRVGHVYRKTDPDLFSAVLRGMRMVYHHRKIDRKLFEKYRRRLSPYGSVASLYFWAAAGGQVPELKDLAPVKKEPAKDKKSQTPARKRKAISKGEK